MGRFNRTTRLRTARFPRVGDTFSGVVQSIVDVPVPEFDGTRIIGPKFDASGTVLTQPDVTIVTDDGEETVIHAGVGIFVAIGQAIEADNLGDLRVGDHLTVTYVADEDADELTPAKVYEAEITRPKSARDAARAVEASEANADGPVDSDGYDDGPGAPEVVRSSARSDAPGA